MKHPDRPKPKVMCRCGAHVDELSSYFGVPLHRNGQAYRVCRLWSGLAR